MVKQRDILTVLFPFTDLSQAKERPVLVISNDRLNAASYDYIMIPLTSNLITPNPNTIRIAPLDLEPGGNLPAVSEIKVNVVFTANRSLIRGKVGVLRVNVFNQVKLALLNLL